MDPDGFPNALGDFPSNIAGNSVKVLISLWNREARRSGNKTLSLLGDESQLLEPIMLLVY